MGFYETFKKKWARVVVLMGKISKTCRYMKKQIQNNYTAQSCVYTYTHTCQCFEKSEKEYVRLLLRTSEVEYI